MPAETDNSIIKEDSIESFILRWKTSGASERANYQSFLTELILLLDLPRQEPHRPNDDENAYVFERRVRMIRPDGEESYGYIDLYKRGCFVCETKQGVESDEAKALSEAARERQARRRRGHGIRGSSAFDEVLIKARNQAERYARALPVSEGRPPFLIVADVGHCIELYSEFTRSGGIYTPFPDARTHRILLDDLRNPKIRERLRLVWTDPLALDPARRTAAVTREISVKLAELSKSFEADGHDPQLAAYFLMRCIFTMFAEDVELIPKDSFSEMLKSLRGQIHVAPAMLESLWRKMDTGGFYPAIWFREKLLRFNGGLFRDSHALNINDDQLELLIEAAKVDWREVEPAIFGTLLERALDPTERHKLGAHYTPRAYVERLVLPTVIEVLRADWQAVQAAAVQLTGENKVDQARDEIEKFHRRLCGLRILDPACGTGNFLYVTLEHLKRLEGEVLDSLELFGGNRQLEMDTVTVRPGQMLGIEINPRAAVIAELVLWIGYLQWHLRTAGDVKNVSEPVLEDAKNIETRDAILSYESKEIVRDESGRPKTHWDGRTTKPHPVTGRPVPDEHARIPVYRYENPRPALWPEADFIVGNPPFIGKGKIREALGDGYVEAIRKTIKSVPSSADFVMYWWDRAAELVKNGEVQRFGFVTTNSIHQTFNRRVLEKHLSDEKKPLSLVFAIPDHPWVDDVDAAAVRVAMTVGEAGKTVGLLQIVESEEAGAEAYEIKFNNRLGEIHSNLTIGVDLTSTRSLVCSKDIHYNGVMVNGSGFILERENIYDFIDSGIESAIVPYINGRELTNKQENRWIIDVSHIETEKDLLKLHPKLFQYLSVHVKPERIVKRDPAFRKYWWRFGRTRPGLRKSLENVRRYIATTETSKHRFFQFVSKDVLPDHMIVAIALEDAFYLGVLSSRIHVCWALAQGGTLEDRPRYNKTRCFETFPFPECSEEQKERIRELAEQLDTHRKSRQEAHPELTMTGMYNVLEKLRSDEVLTAKEKIIHEQGLVSVLRQIHDELDAAVAEAYGWPVDLTDEEILTRLVALNHERAEEEKNGKIRWLRPGYQAPETLVTQTELEGTAAVSKPGTGKSQELTVIPWPHTLPDQIRAVRNMLETFSGPADASAIAKKFKGARKDRVEILLETLRALGHASEVEKEG